MTVTGTNFSTTAGATGIAFGASAATNVSCSSATTCMATSPAGSGAVDVLVTVAGQTSAAVAADRFTYSGASSTASLSLTSSTTTNAGVPVTMTVKALTGSSCRLASMASRPTPRTASSTSARGTTTPRREGS
ncbi:MAG: IPT/TIG domain-containing protein [Trebonia sp.]